MVTLNLIELGDLLCLDNIGLIAVFPCLDSQIDDAKSL